MPFLVSALRAQSSANRKSLMMSFETLVFASSLLRLNTEPSVRYLIPSPTSSSLNAAVSMAENVSLNRVGARTQPYFTPFETENGAGVSPKS